MNQAGSARPGVRLTVIAAVAALGLTSCQSMDDQTKTIGGGAATGAAAGAGLGALLSQNNPGQGALVGAAIGAAAGLLAGVFVDRQKRAYASAEDAIAMETEIVGQKTAELRSYNADARTELASLSREVENLERRRRAGADVTGELRNASERAKAEREAAESKLAETEAELEVTRTVLADVRGAGGDTRAWEREIVALESERDSLRTIAESFRAAEPTL
jgi:hypothetical protein